MLKEPGITNEKAPLLENCPNYIISLDTSFVKVELNSICFEDKLVE